MKVMVLKDKDDDNLLMVLACTDDVDIKTLAKEILDKEYEEDGEIRYIKDICAELQSKYSFETVENFSTFRV